MVDAAVVALALHVQAFVLSGDVEDMERLVGAWGRSVVVVGV